MRFERIRQIRSLSKVRGCEVVLIESALRSLRDLAKVTPVRLLRPYSVNRELISRVVLHATDLGKCLELFCREAPIAKHQLNQADMAAQAAISQASAEPGADRRHPIVTFRGIHRPEDK